MSVASPVIDYIDPDARRIYLKAGIREYHAIDDIYFEVRRLRATDESLRKWDSFVEAGGNVQKTPTTFTPRYLIMKTDGRGITTKIVPDVTVSHSLQVNGEQISDIGTSGAVLIDKDLLPPGINVDVTLQPPGAEIIRLDNILVENSSFNNAVCIDVINGYSGTGYNLGIPIGTRQAPSNNIFDASAIADERGLRSFQLMQNTIISTIDLSSGHSFYGDSPFLTLHIDASADVSSCDIFNLTVSGELDGINVIRDCSVGDVTGVSGIFEKCSFTGTATLIGRTNIYECYSERPGLENPIFIVGSNSLTVRTYGGSLEVQGAQAGHVSSIGIYGGRLIAGPTNVGGEIHVRGDPFRIDDTTGAGCTVFDETGILAAAITTWSKELEGTYTAEEIMRLMASALLGKASGLGTNHPIFRDLLDTVNRIDAITDINGNRNSVTLDAS